MPWDPKPEPPKRPTNENGQLPAAANALPAPTYSAYENGTPGPPTGGGRVKPEAANETQYQGMPSAASYAQMDPQQGGMARAQRLVEQQFGSQAAASLNTMQRGGLALPGQQPKQQGLQLPGQNIHQMQQQYAQQQHQAMQRQQQHLQQQQTNPRIKVETDNPAVQQGQFSQQQRPANPAYGQTDGADDDLGDWHAIMREARAASPGEVNRADRMMRDRISLLSDELESGLMLPLDTQKARLASRKRKAAKIQPQSIASQMPRAGPSIPQLDGDLDEEEDVKNGVKAEDDEDDDAINSDLDDPDDDQNQIGDDDDDLGDSILCTYDKVCSIIAERAGRLLNVIQVQRVKNKWKCTLKDGVLNTGGKEWLFHKGQGNFASASDPLVSRANCNYRRVRVVIR